MAAGEQYFRLAINLASIAAVSRLLTPAEIGISVIGTGIMAITLGLREFATSDFLIQRQEVSRVDIWTSFTVLFLLTTLITAAIFVVAPWFGTLYGEEMLARFLWITAIAALIDTMSMPIRALLRREMAFGRLALINTASVTVTAGMTVLLALSGFSFMSVAWATVAAAATSTFLSFCSRPDLLYFRPAVKSWRSVVAFGGYNGVSHVISQLCEKLPELVLGGMLPPSAVALYNRAVTVSNIPQTILLKSVFTVAFPALAAEMRRGRSLKEMYLRALAFITVLYWPGLAVLALVAHPVVLLLLGEKWLSIVPLVQVMAVAYLAWFPVTLTTPVLLAVGANRDRALVQLVARPLSALVLCCAAYFGIMAMAASLLITLPYLMFVSLYFVHRHLAFRWCEVAAAVWKSAVVTAGTAAGPACVVALTASFDLPIAAAAAAVLLAAAGWIAGVVVTRHPVLLEFRKAIGAIAAIPNGRRFRRLPGRITALGPRARRAEFTALRGDAAR